MSRPYNASVFYRKEYDNMLETLTDRVENILHQFPNFRFPKPYYRHEYKKPFK